MQPGSGNSLQRYILLQLFNTDFETIKKKPKQKFLSVSLLDNFVWNWFCIYLWVKHFLYVVSDSNINSN